MSDIICPDCHRKIRSYEVECAYCGFLLQKYLQENGIDDLKKKILCTRCGQEGNGLMGAVKIKCEYCNIPMVQTGYGIREFAILYNESLEGVPEKVMDSMGISEREYQDMVRRRDPRIQDEMARIKGGNPYALFLKEQFPENFNLTAFESREVQIKQEKEQKQREIESQKPRCPRCGSTNIKYNLEFASWMAAQGQEPVSDSVWKDNKCGNCGFKW